MQELWQNARNALRTMLGPTHYPTFLDHLVPLTLDDGCLVLETSDASAPLLLDARIQGHAERALSAQAGRPLRLTIQVTRPPRDTSTRRLGGPARDALPRELRRTAEPATLDQAGLDAGLGPRLRFDAFVTGPSNLFAHGACQRVVEAPGQSFTPLLIYGGVGLGKSHLLHAVGWALLEDDPTRRIRCISAESLANEFHAALQTRRMDAFRTTWRHGTDVLLVDDIQILQRMERAQEEFFHIFNALTQRQCQIVVTSDRIPEELPELQDRLRSRLSMGLVCDVQPPDIATRRAILARKARELGASVPAAVLDHMAEHVRGNVRHLHGALHRVVTFAQLQGLALTVEVARAQLAHVLHEIQQSRIQIDDVLRAVCEHFGVTLRDLRGRSRVARISEPRKLAMFLARRHADCSYPELGAFFERDHTTVLNAVRAVERELAQGAPLQASIDLIERRFGA
jgi:chromosomal replication initiator protein